MKVADIMTNNVITAQMDMDFTTICRLFFELEIHHIPIVDSNKKLLGIISSNDTLEAFSYHLFKVDSTDDKTVNNAIKIADIMSTEVRTISPATEIDHLAEIFADEKFHALPVVNDNKLLGIVTSNDLLAYCARKKIQEK